ncbi:MAG: AAA family ATPase [Candidatus Methanoplasma sp.]|nr:AAA family ATPase [Candidatus Methanoplasma sp.]
MLKRKMMSELLKWKDNPEKKCLLIKGARQVGKTYIVNEFAKTYPHYIYINFEISPRLKRIFEGDLDIDTLVTEITLRFRDVPLLPKKTLIFLDEIQSCPGARTALKSFSLDGRFDVIASGSLMGLNYREVSSYPVGYEEAIDMHSLDFEEFLWAMGTPEESVSSIASDLRGKKPLSAFAAEEMSRMLRLYLVVGGMPDAVDSFARHRDLGKVLAIQRKIVSGYMDDIAKYARYSDKDKARACLRSVPEQLGGRFRYSGVDGKANVGSRMYGSGLEWLVDAGIVFRCLNLDAPTQPLALNKRFSVFKLFMWDPGLLASMLDDGLAVAIVEGEAHANLGAVAENFVASEIGRRGIEPTYFEKKGKNRDMEVDFVIGMGPGVAAIEVKSGKGMESKSLERAMSGVYGVPRGILLGGDGVSSDERGVERYPLYAAAFIFPDRSGYRF